MGERLDCQAKYGGRFAEEGKVSLSELGSCSSAVECQVTAQFFVRCSSVGLTGLLSDGRVDAGRIEEEHRGRGTEKEGDYSTGRLSGFARPRAQFRHL